MCLSIMTRTVVKWVNKYTRRTLDSQIITYGMTMVSTAYINVYVSLQYSSDSINATLITRIINRTGQQSASQGTKWIIFTKCLARLLKFSWHC